PHYRLRGKQVYCHAFNHTGPQALPFWDGVSLAASRTYDLGQVPLVAVGGDGANWIDGAAGVFHRTVRQRDGFHLARDAARGWGPAAGARLSAALRTGDQPNAGHLLALPPPAAPTAPAATALVPAAAGAPPRPRRPAWAPQQVARARTDLRAQAARPDA